MALKKTASINYFCDGRVSSPDIHDKRVKRLTNVFLVADSVAVTLDFPNGSPFTSGESQINIAADTVEKRKAIPVSSRKAFKYTVSSASCNRRRNDDPTIIVDL